MKYNLPHAAAIFYDYFLQARGGHAPPSPGSATVNLAKVVAEKDEMDPLFCIMAKSLTSPSGWCSFTCSGRYAIDLGFEFVVLGFREHEIFSTSDIASHEIKLSDSSFLIRKSCDLSRMCLCP